MVWSCGCRNISIREFSDLIDACLNSLIVITRLVRVIHNPKLRPLGVAPGTGLEPARGQAWMPRTGRGMTGKGW